MLFYSVKVIVKISTEAVSCVIAGVRSTIDCIIQLANKHKPQVNIGNGLYT